MNRPSVSGENSLLRKHDIVVESICSRKKDMVHYHDYVQLWYVFSGTLCHSVRDKEYLQTPGSCVIVLPFTEHAINTLDSDDTPVMLSLSFTGKFLTNRGFDFFPYLNESAHFKEFAIPEFSVLKDDCKEKADELAREMLSEFTRDKKTNLNNLSRLLCEFLSIICTEPADKKESSELIEHVNAVLRAVRYMADHLNQKILRDDLCALTAMSRTSFSQTFKAVTGTTTKQFLLGLRLRRAQYLLQYTDKSLNEIAEEIGLYDKSRLANLFFEHFGIPPIQFRYTTRPEALESDKQTQRRMSFYPKFLCDNNISDTNQNSEGN